MKTTATRHGLLRHLQTQFLSLALLCACSTGLLLAQAPCPEVQTFAAGLVAPSKIIQTPLDNFIVAEGGPEVPNHGRISIVGADGSRRTLLDGLPSARTFVGDLNGTTGVALKGRTLYVLNGQRDVTNRSNTASKLDLLTPSNRLYRVRALP